MFINSYKARSLAQRDELSFQGFFTFPNITGLSEFGFSGDTVMSWTFSGGRILDPEGNYTYDYLTNNSFVLSGNINTGIYNYYIGDQYIAQYPKVNGKFDHFYVDTHDTTFNLDLNIMSSGQDVTYTYPTTFDTGNAFSFAIHNTNTGYYFRIFSGDLLLSNAETSIFDFQTGSFPQTVTSGTNIIIRDLGAERGAVYPFTYTLYTNQGNLTGNFSVIDNIPTYFIEFDLVNLNNSGYANFFYDSGDATDLTYTTQNNFRYGNYRLDYTIDTPSTGKSLTIELAGLNGNTGNYLAPFVSGINPTTSGFGYSSAPTIVFQGGGGVGAAATVSLAGGYVNFNSISFTSFGTGYTSAPDVIFSGGSPTYEASGIASLSGYTKTFFNTWTLYSGDSISTLSSFATQTGVDRYISTVPLPYTVNSLLIVAANRNWWDTDLNYAQLTVSGLDNTSETFTITGGYVV